MNLNPENGTEGQDLREVRDYFFGKDGHVDSIRIDYYYDGQKIGDVGFSYTGLADAFGFNEPNVKNGQNMNIGGLVITELPYVLLRKIKMTKKFISFQETGKGRNYHFMLNEKDFGPLSVDSVISPGSNDIIVLGIPSKPIKIYQVKDKVHERNVHLYTYLKNGDHLSFYSRSEYPFDIVRTMCYSGRGICTGYVDSTFSGKTFLTKTKGKFLLNSKDIPVKFEKIKQNHQGVERTVSIEKYQYEYY